TEIQGRRLPPCGRGHPPLLCDRQCGDEPTGPLRTLQLPDRQGYESATVAAVLAECRCPVAERALAPPIAAGDAIERLPERPARTALAVTTQSATDCLDVRTVLDRDRENDRAVSRVRVRRRIRLLVVQEDFPDPTI